MVRAAAQHVARHARDPRPTRHSGRHSGACPRSLDRWRRPLAALVAAGGVGLLSTGAYASWQATASASTASLDAATSSLEAIDASGGRLSVAVGDLLPGDWLHRYVDVKNAGTVAAATTQTAQATGPLSAGLLVSASTCSVAWDTAAGTCAGTTTALGSGPLTSPVVLGTTSIAAGGVAHVRYRVELASTAPQSLMGSTATVTVSATTNLVGGRERTAS